MDVLDLTISEPSVLMTALNNVLPLVYLLGLILLVYLLVRHLRKEHTAEKRKNQ